MNTLKYLVLVSWNIDQENWKADHNLYGVKYAALPCEADEKGVHLWKQRHNQ